MVSRLNIDGIDVGYNSLLPISTNFLIADIYEPDKRSGAYSKTITIPGTKEINQIFEFSFDVNIESSSFNANLKVSASYYVNEVEIFKGSIRLIKILKSYDGQFISANYECQLIGNSGNLFLDIYNKFLTDIDVSDLNHNFEWTTNHLNPNAPITRPSYFYPFIDYGFSGNFGIVTGLPTSVYPFENLKPAIFEDVFVSRIFSDAGYTYSGSYLGSAQHKKIFIPDSSEGKLKMSNSDVLNNQIYVGRTTDTSNTYSGTHIGGSPSNWSYSPLHVIAYNNDSTGGYTDAGNRFNTSTYIFTQAINGHYNLNANLNFRITITPPAGTVTISGTTAIWLDIQYYNGSTWISYLAASATPIISGLVTNSNVGVNIPGTLFNNSTQWRVITNSTVLVNYKNGGGLDITTGSSSISFTTLAGSNFSAQLTSAELLYGNPVTMSDVIPKDVRQIDFLTSIIKLENLYVDVDKNDYKNYIIEPRDIFINASNVVDWTSKLDVSRQIQILPMGDLDARKYIFKYKDDVDYFNKYYIDKYKEPYSTQNVNVQNDFNTSEKVIDTIFSATPVAQFNNGQVVCPRFWTLNGTQKNNIRVNIRRLVYGGLVNPFGTVTYNSGQNQYYPNMPFCGMVDNPYAPTFDLGFGTPKEIFWSLPSQTYTNQNRYNVRYSKFITEITDKDSKVVIAYFNLNEIDISNFKFSQLVFCDGTYYIVNKIEDYDPQIKKTVKVTLLKYKDGGTIANTNTVLIGIGGSGSGLVGNGQPFDYTGNYGNNSFGERNINFSSDSFVFGSGNTISI